MTLPNFLIVGAMKCGTTTLYGALAEHPEVFLPTHKELHFFGHRYPKGVDWYSSKFTPAAHQNAVGEATPIYMFDPLQRRRMIELLPDVKIVAILRDPVDRAYSHYWYDRARALESMHTFEQALEMEQAGRDPASVHDRKRTYLARGHYVGQLQALERHYGRDRMHVMLMEDLLGDTPAALRSLLAFLEVDVSWADRIQLPHDNSFGEREPKGVKKATSPAMARVLQEAYDSLPEGRYPRLDAAQREQVGRHFAASNGRLAEWLGRDLSHWT